ncbi:MAG: bifunctional fructose-bisphosphatase/inositol-phosphate phosphatase [Methanosarcinales archaeon]|nr:bifunctional fructose-bisphosphatase/inositol-phosphate phosphatase [Methanosarcinales archaeon]
MGLSSEARELKSLCDSMAKSVSLAVREMVGRPTSGTFVQMGADGTPTKSIDKLAEDAAIAPLRDYGTGFRILSEEMGEMAIGGEPEYFIHLDPLDGTFNAIQGIPFYSVSIFISNQRCRLGYVCDLARQIRYFGQAGGGAFRESGEDGEIQPIRVSATSVLKDFSISAYTIRPHSARITSLGDRVRRIRTLGSTSLELCYLADGKLDAFVDLRGGLRVVDVAAGMLIVSEAGGTVSDVDGQHLTLREDMWQRTDLIASNGLLHREILGMIRGDDH